MCNEAARRIALDQLRTDWSELKIPLRFPEGLPNMAPLESIKITDTSAIIRPAREAERRTPSYVTRIVRLAFLSPAVVDAILAGRQRTGVDVAVLKPGLAPVSVG